MFSQIRRASHQNRLPAQSCLFLHTRPGRRAAAVAAATAVGTAVSRQDGPSKAGSPLSSSGPLRPGQLSPPPGPGPPRRPGSVQCDPRQPAGSAGRRRRVVYVCKNPSHSASYVCLYTLVTAAPPSLPVAARSATRPESGGGASRPRAPEPGAAARRGRRAPGDPAPYMGV